MKTQDYEPVSEEFVSDFEGSDTYPAGAPSVVKATSSGSSIKISINDPSGSGNAADALKDIHRFLASNIDRNLSVFFSSVPNGINSITSSASPTPSFIGLPSIPNALITTPTGKESTGFPAGYFRIRAAGTGLYWSLHWGENHADGNALCLWQLHDVDQAEQTFFVNEKGEFCTRGLGIDVMGTTLIVSQNRPPTVPWPNPWSHPLPTFVYSPQTKMISVRFHIDPVISNQWPRPESEWKDPYKRFVVSARPPAEERIYKFNEISRWAPNARFVAWTSRAGDKWGANDQHALGVVEEKVIVETGETDRMRWEIEQV